MRSLEDGKETQRLRIEEKARSHPGAETAGWTNGLTYVAGGRIYDDSQDDPYWFYYPSLNVNVNGDVVIGFSGSRQME